MTFGATTGEKPIKIFYYPVMIWGFELYKLQLHHLLDILVSQIPPLPPPIMDGVRYRDLTANTMYCVYGAISLIILRVDSSSLLVG